MRLPLYIIISEDDHPVSGRWSFDSPEIVRHLQIYISAVVVAVLEYEFDLWWRSGGRDHQLTNVRLIQLDCCFKVATRAVPDEEDPPQQQQQQMRGKMGP